MSVPLAARCWSAGPFAASFDVCRCSQRPQRLLSGSTPDTLDNTSRIVSILLSNTHHQCHDHKPLPDSQAKQRSLCFRAARGLELLQTTFPSQSKHSAVPMPVKGDCLAPDLLFLVVCTAFAEEFQCAKSVDTVCLILLTGNQGLFSSA